MQVGSRYLLDGRPVTVTGWSADHNWPAVDVVDAHGIARWAMWGGSSKHRWAVAPFRWVDPQGCTISGHGDLASAGNAHRKHCRSDIRCLDASGADVTDTAITASIEWR